MSGEHFRFDRGEKVAACRYRSSSRHTNVCPGSERGPCNCQSV